MNEYIWETPDEIDLALAGRVREIRKRRGLSQEKLSKESGVSLGSLKRFESTGMISLLSLTKLAMALGCVDGNGANPGEKELLAVGKKDGLSRPKCKNLMELVRDRVNSDLKEYVLQ